MLALTLPGEEMWDDESEQFYYTDGVVLQFEHSLVSLSKWESIFHKPFLTDDKRTEDEMYGYVKAMLLTPGAGDDMLSRLTEEHIVAINDYINNPMTGTTVRELPQSGPRTSERISAELIYFWMSQYQIPYEAREWHLNQLFTLIKIHHAKSQKQKKVPRQTQAQQMAELNAQRRKQLGTNG